MRATGRLHSLYRYPVKGFTAQALTDAELEPDRGIRHDRRFAIVNGWMPVDESGDWAPCQSFLRLNRNRSIGRFRLTFDADKDNIVFSHADGRLLDVALGDPASVAQANDTLISWFEKGPLGHPRLAEADKGFWDHRDAVISIINLASVAAIAATAGEPINPLRFRGNLHVEGFEAWEELDWPGRTLTVGDCELEVFSPIARCGAPTVDPDSGDQNINVLGILAADFGHECLGVYARVRRAGRVRPGDPVVVGPQRNRTAIGTALAYGDAVPAINWPRPAAIETVEPCGRDVAHVWITDNTLDYNLPLPPIEAGQHMRLHMPEMGWRCYTVTDHREGAFRITVKRVQDGAMSNLLHRANPGSTLAVTGPFGAFVYPQEARQAIAILTAGIGITPAYALLRRAATENPAPRILLLNITRDDLDPAYWKEIEALAAALPAVRLIRHMTGVDEDVASQHGALHGRPDLATINWSEFRDGEVFLCGPAGFVANARNALGRLGIRQDRIHDEPFVSPRQHAGMVLAKPLDSGPFNVSFVGEQETIDAVWNGEETLLGLTDALGLRMPAQCRSGVCGKCRKQVAAGNVQYVLEPSTTVPDGFALLCCSVPASDLKLVL